MGKHKARECAPPDPEIFHVSGRYAPPIRNGWEALHVMRTGGGYLAPGDYWRCECGRRYIYTPDGWRRRLPLYWFMTYGKEWTPDRITRWQERVARGADD